VVKKTHTCLSINGNSVADYSYTTTTTTTIR